MKNNFTVKDDKIEEMIRMRKPYAIVIEILEWSESVGRYNIVLEDKIISKHKTFEEAEENFKKFIKKGILSQKRKSKIQ